MINVYPTLPADLVSTLRGAGGIRTAIETGTFKGNGALVLAEIFVQAYSIELLPEIWQEKYVN